MANDKPAAPTFTLAALRKEASANSVEPFVLALDGSKRITFADPLGIPTTKLDYVLGLAVKATRGETSGLDFFRELLSEKDYETYVGLDLPARAHLALVARVGEHFSESMAQAGGPGESVASPA